MLDLYKSSLLEIIAHCKGMEQTEQTPSDYSDAVLKQDELDWIREKYETGKQVEIQDIYPLTPMQEGMLFHALMDTESAAYFEQKTLTCVGEIDLPLFEESLNLLIARYDILRTVIVHEYMSSPKQILFKARIATVSYRDFSGLRNGQLEEAIQKYEREDRDKGFELSEELLLRLSVIQLSSNQYKVIWSSHHILMDGWCSGIILKDFLQLYASLRTGQSLRLEEPAPYAKYIQWLQKQPKRKAKSYWADYVEGYETIARIPGKEESRENGAFRLRKLEFRVDKMLTESLINLSKEAQVTMNTVIQAVWGILLQKYTNTEDVVFGSVVSGRNADVEGIEGMVGLFINTIPVRIRNERNDRFIDLLQATQRDSLEAVQYDYYPLAEIQSLSEVKQRLVNHIVIFQNFYIDSTMTSNDEALGFGVKDIQVYEQTNYDFHVMILPDDEVTVMFTYNEYVYDEDAVIRVKNHFMQILETVIGDQNICISEIEMLTVEEKQQLLYALNDTKEEYPREKTVHTLFEEQAQRTPDRIAVAFGERQMTYRELNEKSNQLARQLQSHGVKADTLVGVMVDRSIEMIIGILGILKAGGAYLPLDPQHPVDRIRYMLEDARIELLVTTNGSASSITFEGTILDIADERMYTGDYHVEAVSTWSDLAYVIYTSGSTGNPKGVMVEHQQVNNFMHGITRTTELEQYTCMLCVTTISFDIFGLETLTALATGLKVVVASDDESMDGGKLGDLMTRHGVQVMQSTPSRYRMLLGNSRFREAMGALKAIVVGGEELPEQLRRQLQAFPTLRVYNVYGPTETTIWSTVKRMESEGTVTIGKPIQNTQVYILNGQHQMVPLGVPGEMCIGGDGVTRGYLNRGELTQEKFVEDRFVQGGRMYRTGDLAKWSVSGEIEFLGRIDNQVKIRGYRIELGEIENRLLSHEGIWEAAVLAKEDAQQKYLCAYIVGDVELGREDIKGHLKQTLPDYMIPSYFIHLDRMPLTSNGKLNRKALPEPDKSGAGTEAYEAPHNELQQALAEIWSEVLDIAEIGINDHFFELGGHSLKATLVMNEIHKRLKVEIPLRALFQHPTIKELSGYIGQHRGGQAYVEIRPCEEQTYYETSSAQKRMYALQQLEPGSTAYHMPAIFELEGDVDRGGMEAIFEKLVQRHEALRTSFETIDGEIVQRIRQESSFTVLVRQTEEADPEAIVAGFIRPFALNRAPLMRVELVESKEKRYLLVDMHHIISDGVSMGILIQEFAMLHNGKELEPLRIQYKDFAAWQNEQWRRGAIEQQEKYWLEQFRDGVPVLHLPYDYERPVQQSFDGEKIGFVIDEQATGKLRELAKQTESTMHMVLLAVFNVLLAKYSGQEDIVVGVPVAGRPHADLQRIMGMFVNTLAIRNKPRGDQTFIQFLQDVKENSLQAYDHQSYQLEHLLEKVQYQRKPGRNPLFDAMFDMTNAELANNIKLNGLTLNQLHITNHIAKFDLTLKAIETNSKLEMAFEYTSKLFKMKTIHRAAEDMKLIIDQITNQRDTVIQSISIMNQAEESSMLQIENAVHALKSTGFSF
jgi:iturin family lipopeptide synthetase B